MSDLETNIEKTILAADQDLRIQSPTAQSCDPKKATVPRVFCFGVNHKTAGIHLREKIFAQEQQIIEKLPEVRSRFGFDELAVLSTCNRFELFGTSASGKVGHPGFPLELIDAIEALDALHTKDPGKPTTNIKRELGKVAYCLRDHDAARHLLSVAASLDSLVVGETQITGQFKDALAAATMAGTMGPILTRLGHDALATAKKVRTKTSIGRGRLSISHAAVDLVRKIFRDPADQNYVVIGAGEMAEVAARCIAQKNPRSLTIVNRSPDRARHLVESIGYGRSVSFEWLEDHLLAADVVISATAAPGHVISGRMVRNIMRGKSRGARLLLVDIALPRDIDPTCAEHDEVFLFDIDDLQQVVDQGREDRLAAAREASDIIDQATLNWTRWLNQIAVAPTIHAIRDQIDTTIRREALKTLSSDPLLDLRTDQKERLWKLFEVIAARLTARAARGLRQAVDEGEAEVASEILRRIFLDQETSGLESPTDLKNSMIRDS